MIPMTNTEIKKSLIRMFGDVIAEYKFKCNRHLMMTYEYGIQGYHFERAVLLADSHVKMSDSYANAGIGFHDRDLINFIAKIEGKRKKSATDYVDHLLK
ncbi:hypothetical protein [Priestia megaterium]|uniref:hypothetical protein n=1 Tax=Priestia megaterium TaxID=1404 RepID=UPI00112BCE78|nr:hypothetical protein [Priestia megaterium]TPF18013.1 hypothetical protein CBE78_01955 [Priestia megaterium]TPF22120.1 hypothetical protein CBE79_04460 [Priestia megaterium]